MKKIVSLVIMCVVSMPAFAVSRAGDAVRGGNSNTARTVSSKQQIAMASMSVSAQPVATVTTDQSSVRVEPEKPVVEQPSEPTVDMREKERLACVSNNIGMGNTFVWASRYSNISDYASMVEDVENPENNVCFVRVEVKSDDQDVKVSDIQGKYFEFGREITCGAWADEGVLRQRILDAKKTKRTWGTVAGVVGGAAVGVGAMELFGNKAIGGAVEGQKSMDSQELLRSQLLVLKKDNKTEYDKFIKYAKELKRLCVETDWGNTQKPSECTDMDYDFIIAIEG